MTIEVVITPACNIKCTYCYQDPMRDAGNFGVGLPQFDRIFKSIEQANVGAKKPGFTVFGGDPLLNPIQTLERLWGFGLEKYGHNGVQTNGELITDEHITLFIKYNVGVGISVDGPWPLNKARSDEKGTNKTLDAIKKLREVNRPPAISVTISRANASPERLDQLLNWIKEIGEWTSEIRFHSLEVDGEKAKHLVLSEADEIAAYRALSTLKIKAIIQPMLDMRNLLAGKFDDVGCTWNGCDPLSTPAVQGIGADGRLTNCGRTNKDGVMYQKANTHGNERTIALYHTPYEAGGCKDCRYFFACRGQCPGEAIDGDWRNRSSHCRLYYALFEDIEKEVGRIPDDKIKEYERRITLSTSGHGDQHGDVQHVDHNILMVPVKVKS
jgi:uncharacterized protein